MTKQLVKKLLVSYEQVLLSVRVCLEKIFFRVRNKNIILYIKILSKIHVARTLPQ